MDRSDSDPVPDLIEHNKIDHGILSVVFFIYILSMNVIVRCVR